MTMTWRTRMMLDLDGGWFHSVTIQHRGVRRDQGDDRLASEVTWMIWDCEGGRSHVVSYTLPLSPTLGRLG